MLDFRNFGTVKDFFSQWGVRSLIHRDRVNGPDRVFLTEKYQWRTNFWIICSIQSYLNFLMTLGTCQNLPGT